MTAVWSRGREVIDGEEFVGRAGHGRFLSRGLTHMLR